MRQAELKPGTKSLERGSTFASKGAGFGRRSDRPKQRSISPASPDQREKARTEPCVVTGYEAIDGYVVDPGHLCARGRGGCDDPLCTVPIYRPAHRAFDDGDLDLLPYLVGKRTAELQHALGHYEGDLLGLLHRLTGDRYVPEKP